MGIRVEKLRDASYFSTWAWKGFSLIVAVLIIFTLLFRLDYLIDSIRYPYVGSWGYTEMLINYEGGFVRRGLTGQMTYYLADWISVSPLTVINCFCLSFFLFTVCFYCWNFYKKNLNLWLLCSAVFFGSTWCVIRKDYLEYTVLICVLLLLKNTKRSYVRITLSLLLMFFALLCHEGFMFWGIPAILLVMISRSNTRNAGIASAIILSCVFLLICLFRGNHNCTLSIIDSWNNLMGFDFLTYNFYNSIGALEWKLVPTFSQHFRWNFYSDSLGWGLIIVQLLMWLVLYYMLTNFMFIFRMEEDSVKQADKTAFSALLIFLTITMLPMFFLFSGELDRDCQYIAMTATAVYMILPPEKYRTLFPTIIKYKVEKFNAWLIRIVPPSKWLMLVLILIWAPLQLSMDFEYSRGESPLYVAIARIYDSLFMGQH